MESMMSFQLGGLHIKITDPMPDTDHEILSNN